jgi:hypothetical protein
MATDSNDPSETLGYRIIVVACAILNGALWQFVTVGHLKVSTWSFIINFGFGLATAIVAIVPTILIHGLVSCFSPHSARAPRYAQAISYVVYNVACLAVGAMFRTP